MLVAIVHTYNSEDDEARLWAAKYPRERARMLHLIHPPICIIGDNKIPAEGEWFDRDGHNGIR